MAVKMAPNAAQAAPISGSADQMRTGANNARRETVESQGNVSAGIAEKPARNVPERRTEQQSENDERSCGQAVKFRNIFRTH